jgi:hypothetical protein
VHDEIYHTLISLGEIALKLEKYGEALQFYERLHDMLMETAPRSEDMAMNSIKD